MPFAQRENIALAYVKCIEIRINPLFPFCLSYESWNAFGEKKEVDFVLNTVERWRTLRSEKNCTNPRLRRRNPLHFYSTGTRTDLWMRNENVNENGSKTRTIENVQPLLSFEAECTLIMCIVCIYYIVQCEKGLIKYVTDAMCWCKMHSLYIEQTIGKGCKSFICIQSMWMDAKKNKTKMKWNTIFFLVLVLVLQWLSSIPAHIQFRIISFFISYFLVFFSSSLLRMIENGFYSLLTKWRFIIITKIPKTSPGYLLMKTAWSKRMCQFSKLMNFHLYGIPTATQNKHTEVSSRESMINGFQFVVCSLVRNVNAYKCTYTYRRTHATVIDNVENRFLHKI